MKIIIFGIQGSGKGTQGKLLEERFGFTHITTGEVFRHNMEAETKLGVIAKGFIDRGELVPDNYVIDIVKEALAYVGENFVMDGFPRNEVQQKYLLENYKIDIAISLNLEKWKAIKRITSRRICRNCQQDYNLWISPPKKEGICDLCGGKVEPRDDDVEFAIERRIERFHESTEKVINNFRDMNMLIELNAERPIMEVHAEIVEKLKLQ